MAVDPLSITTAIITLGNTLERAINLLNDIQDAPQKVIDIKKDCNLTQGVLKSIRRQLRATEVVLPTLHIQGNEDEDAGVNLANLLRDNVDQLQLDLNSLLEELERLDRSGNSESRIYGWISRGVLGFRMSYLVGMQRKIVTKRGQLQLVQSSLQLEVNSRVNLERQVHHDDMAAMLIGMLRLFDPTSNIMPIARRMSTASGASSPRARDGRERLMRAVKRGRRHDAEVLLRDIWADPNFLDDQDGLSPLCVAAINGDLAMIEVLLQHGALVDRCSRDLASPLMFALLYSHPVAALALIRRGADISHTDSRNSSALHFAVHRNFYAVVQVLLRNGADPNLRDIDGRTPLREAVSRDDREIQPQDTSVLRILLEPNRHGIAADPLLGTHEHNYNPVHHAARNGHLADLIVLTDPKYTVDTPTCSAPDSENHTPLWFASHGGHIHIINHLLTICPQDANTPSRDPENPTPLMALAFSKYASPDAILDGASALLTAGADPNARNSHGLTLLHRLASNDNTPLLSLLLSHGADPSLPDNTGKLALHHAASAGNEDALTTLLQHEPQTHPSPSVNAPDNESRTPLMLAAASGHDYIIHTLLHHSADPNLVDIRGCTAFYLACAWGHILTASLLLGAGADINCANEKGNTALHAAVRMGRREVVRWLLRMGADAGIKSFEAFEGVDVVGTAGEVARGVGDEEVGRLVEGWDLAGRGGRRGEVWRVGVEDGGVDGGR